MDNSYVSIINRLHDIEYKLEFLSACMKDDDSSNQYYEMGKSIYLEELKQDLKEVISSLKLPAHN